MNKAAKFFGLIVGTILMLYVLRWTNALAFNGRQILSISIFSMFIYGTLLFGEFRLAFAFGGVALLMACNLLTVERFTQSASLDVLIFLIGTFLVIGFLEEAQFFEHVVSGIVAAVGPKPQTLLIVLMILASLSSALVGEVTAILFMAGAMLHLTSKYKLNPAPFIIMLVFASNVGSAMSSIGNPIGVLIALKTGLGFVEFVKWAMPVSLVVDVVTFLICRWYFAEAFNEFATAVHGEFARQSKRSVVMAGGGTSIELATVTSDRSAFESGGAPSHAHREEHGSADFSGVPDAADPRSGAPMMGESFFSEGPSNEFDGFDATGTYRLCWAILAGLIGLLVTHQVVEKALGLREGTMMVAAALIMGSLVLFLRREKARELLERRVDWWTLSFFMMLFASVGTLQDTHVTQVIADKISSISGGQMMTTQLIGWATGWLSAFLDNVLAVATFMPVVHDVRVKAGVPYSSMIYWFMLFGGTFMGNMTIIGSTANIVAVGLLEKRGHGTISFGYWMKIGVIVSVASMLVATGLLFAMAHLPEGHRIPMLAVPVAEARSE